METKLENRLLTEGLGSWECRWTMSGGRIGAKLRPSLKVPSKNTNRQAPNGLEKLPRFGSVAPNWHPLRLLHHRGTAVKYLLGLVIPCALIVLSILCLWLAGSTFKLLKLDTDWLKLAVLLLVVGTLAFAISQRVATQSGA